MKKYLVLSLVAVLLFFPCALFAANCGGSPATYYVDYSAANDTANGTSTDTPWKHCPGDDNAGGNAACSLQPGDTVIFKGGVSYIGKIDIDVSGSEGSPITYNGNTAGTWGTGRAVIDGNATLYYGFYSAAGRNYITIDNFDIQNQAWSNGTAGIYIPGPSTGIIIQNNIVHEIGSWSTTDKFSEILVQGGIHLGSSTGATTSATIQHNEVYKTGQYGIQIYGGDTCLIEHNTVHYVVWGIDVGSASATLGATDNTIRGNTIYDIGYMLYRTTTNPTGFFANEVSGTVANPCATCSNTKMEAAGSPGWTVNAYQTTYLIYNTSDNYSRAQVLSSTADTVTSASLSGGSSNTWAAGNTFQMFQYPHPDGIFLRQGSGTYPEPTGNIIEGNLLYDTVAYSEQLGGTGGISLSVVGDTTIRNNVLINAMFQPAIYVYSGHDVKILNNTVYNISSTTASVLTTLAPTGTAGNFTIKNNIFVGGWLYTWNADALTNRDVDNNFWSSDRLKPFALSTGTYYTFAEYRALDDSPDASGQFDASEANILFADVATQATANLADLKLSIGSPAIEAGADLSATGFTTDKDGVDRPQGVLWDAGAYEYEAPAGSFIVTPSIASGSGTISPAVAETVASGGNSSTYTATPANGWKVTWSDDAASCGTASTCQLTNVTANKTVTVTFTEIMLMPW